MSKQEITQVQEVLNRTMAANPLVEAAAMADLMKRAQLRAAGFDSQMVEFFRGQSS